MQLKKWHERCLESLIWKYQFPFIHFLVTLDIFGLFEEAKTSQKVPKWIILVVYSTEWLKSWGQQLNLPVFDQILYSCAEIQTLDGPNLKTKDPCSKLNNVLQGLESNFKCLYLAKEWVQMVKKCVLVGGQDARTLALIKYHKCEVAVAPNWLQYFDKETLNFRNWKNSILRKEKPLFQKWSLMKQNEKICCKMIECWQQ